MTNLENLKKLAENLGADASGAMTNLGALNVISAALGGSGDAETNAEAIEDIAQAAPGAMEQNVVWVDGITDFTLTDESGIHPMRNMFKSIAIPDGVKVIGEAVFDQFITLEKVSIPDSVETIESNAFTGCYGIKGEIKLVNVTELGASAFGGCAGVEAYYLPNKLVKIGTGAFGGNNNLSHVYATGDAGELPEEVESDIGESLFGGNGKIVYVELPEGIRSIKGGMFGGCSSLETVIVHDKLTNVESAFGGASKIKTIRSKSETRTDYDIIFPNSVTTIGASGSVFGGCFAFSSVFIPESVTTIGSSAFGGTGITKIDIEKPENSISGAPWGATNATVNWLG